MKIVAFKNWFDCIDINMSQKDVVLSGETHFHNIDLIKNVDLVFLDEEHTNHELLLNLANKEINVVCKGIWHIDGYLSIVKEFSRHKKFVIEDESFLFYEKVVEFVNMAKKILLTDCMPHIEVKTSFNNIYAAVKLITVILPDIRQVSIEQCIKTSTKDLFLCKMGKHKILFEIDKMVMDGLGKKYYPKSVDIEIQTSQGNLTLRGYAGPILWESLYPEINRVVEKDFKGYLFHPVAQIIGNDECYDEYINKEYKRALACEIQRIIEHISNNDSILPIMQQQSTVIKCCDNIFRELSGSKNFAIEYSPILLEGMMEKERTLVSPEEIFGEFTTEYLEYSVKRRNEVMAQTMLAYMNAKGVLHKGEPCTVNQILSKLNTKDEFRMIILRWIALLLKYGYIVEKGLETYVALYDFSKRQLELGWKEVKYLWCEKLESSLVLQYLINNIKNWDKLIPKEQNATLLLFEQGEDSYADALYKDTKILLYTNQLLSRIAMQYMASKKENIAILEIGAGTGATSDIILRDVEKNGYSQNVTYYYTDISKYFLQKAKERYNCYEHKIDLRYQILDIDQSFSEQLPFEIEVDIVIAVGVLNNSVDTDKCIRQINRIMKNEGILLIIETVEDVPDMLLSQAFMMSVPSDRRIDNNTTFLTKKQWVEILQESGFTNIVEYPDNGSRLEIMGQKLFYVTKGEDINVLRDYKENTD